MLHVVCVEIPLVYLIATIVLMPRVHSLGRVLMRVSRRTGPIAPLVQKMLFALIAPPMDNVLPLVPLALSMTHLLVCQV